MKLRSVALSLLLVSALACGRDAPPTAPNVLLITVDTLRADYLGSYGFDHETSPRIDALAAEGVVFERAIAAGTQTAPAHASIMTARFPREHSIGTSNGATVLEGVATLAEQFRAAGYDTAAFVGNVVLRRRIGLDQGFDVYDDELPNAELNRPDIFERIAVETTAKVRAWLGGTPGPFFLWVHFQDPHGPYAPPEPWAGHFQFEGRAGERALKIVDNVSKEPGMPEYQKLEGLDRASQYRARYADEIRYTDASVGELLDSVDGHASGRDTIVLFTSDHGESMGEAGHYFTHGSNTLPSQSHVPFILRASGLGPGRFEAIVSHVDVMPTLLDLAGLSLPEGLSGVALGPLVREGRSPGDRLVVSDLGIELSLYRDDHILRAWRRAPERRSERREQPPLRWTRYAWRDGSYEARGALDEADRDRVRAYLDAEVPTARGPDVDPELFEKLKALGYVNSDSARPE